jgi:hypothetical protein
MHPEFEYAGTLDPDDGIEEHRYSKRRGPELLRAAILEVLLCWRWNRRFL